MTRWAFRENKNHKWRELYYWLSHPTYLHEDKVEPPSVYEVSLSYQFRSNEYITSWMVGRSVHLVHDSDELRG